MTTAIRTSSCAARVRAVVAVLVACACGSLAAAATAATTDPAANGGAPVIGSDSGSTVASAAAAPGPGTPAPSSAWNLIIVGQAPSGGPTAAASPAAGGPVRDQPAVLAAGASAGPVGRPSAPAGRGSLETQIITTAPHHLLAPSPRPAVAQLDSGGPLVGSAGGAGAPAPKVAPAPPHPAVPAAGLASLSRGLPLFAAPPAAIRTVSVSVAMEGVYLSASTSARRPGQRPSAVADPRIGPAGLGSVSLEAPFGPGPPVPGSSAWLGSAPVSSSGTSGIALSGLTAVLAAMTLLAGASWRRGAWLRPPDGLNSLLAASARDRPG